mgnify:CR=1 FL=1
MILMMIFCCALLLVALFFVVGGFSSGGYLWPILIGVFIIAHVWMMFKGHGGRQDDDTEDEIDDTSAK